MSKVGDVVNADLLLANEFEPQRKHKYILKVAGVDIPAFVCKSADKPKKDITKTTYEYGNTKKHFAGKGTWGDVNIVLINPIAPNMSKVILDWIKQSENSINGRSGYAKQYKKNITIDTLGPVGEIVESWTYIGAFLTSVDWGAHDQSDDSFQEISLTVSIDDADME